MSSRAIVIGAGFGGIAAALRLRARGYDVTIIDKQSQLGGRGTAYHRNGLRLRRRAYRRYRAFFVRRTVRALRQKARKTTSTFVPVYPWYRIQFHDGTHFDYGGTLEQTLADRSAKSSPPDCRRVSKIAEKDEGDFRRRLHSAGGRPVRLDDVDAEGRAGHDASLGTWRTVWQMASASTSRSDKLRRVFSFQPLLVGGNPFNTTSIYSLIQYLEREWGVHFAMGGTGAIVAGLGTVDAGGRD